MKILIVVDSFFKKAHVAAFRAGFFNQYLVRAGHETFILTSKIDKKDPNETFVRNAAKKVYFYNRPKLYLFTKPIKGILSKIFSILKIDLKKDVLQELLFIPDIYAWGIPFRMFQVLIICIKNKIDVVFISASPNSLSFSGLLARSVLKKPVILELRDVWCPEKDPLFMKNIWIHNKISKLQGKFVLTYISKLVIVTKGAERFYKKKYPKLDVEYIYSASHPKIEPEEYKKTNEFIILLFGHSHLNIREPILLFKALEKATFEVTVQFLGEEQWYANYAKSYFQFFSNIKIMNSKPVPLEEASKYLNNATILYLFQNKDVLDPAINTAIASKTYHYIASGRFILADLPPGDNLGMLKEYCNNYYAIASKNPEEVLQAIKAVHTKWQNGENLVTLPKEIYWRDYNWEKSAQKLISIMHSVVS